MKTPPNKAERAHMSAVADLGCIIHGCGGPAECHHPRDGAGAGQRSSHYDVIPLCAPHHRLGGFGIAIHAGQKTFEAKFGTERELLTRTTASLIRSHQCSLSAKFAKQTAIPDPSSGSDDDDTPSVVSMAIKHSKAQRKKGKIAKWC